MSLESAKKFIEKMRSDREFAEKISACEDSAARWNFVKEAGFDFTAEEVQEAQSELTDEEMDIVAGGGWNALSGPDSNSCFSMTVMTPHGLSTQTCQ